MAHMFMDDEATLFEAIQLIRPENIICLTGSKAERKLCRAIANREAWVNNSKDTNNPPDLYSTKYKFMGDLMQIDDSGHYEVKGKKEVYVNREKEANGKAYKRMVEGGNFLNKRGTKRIFIFGDTDEIPTHEHHKYDWYVKEFQRITKQHIESIPLYKQKFPNYKTIFFIVDESTQYIQTASCLYSPTLIQLNSERNEVHYPYLDEKFLLALQERMTGVNGETFAIDYVVWYMPNKYIHTTIGPLRPLPHLVILDMNNINKIKRKKYPSARIISTER